MRWGTVLTACSLLSLAACGPARRPAPPALAYALPGPTAATYTRGDSANMDIDADGQTFRMRLAASAMFAASFARASDGVRVSMDVSGFSGRLIEPMQDPVSLGNGAVRGPLVFTLDRRGLARLVSEPQVSPPADRVFEALALIHSFFPRLPGHAVKAGSSWTDTIHFRGPAAGGTTQHTNVLTYVVSGDTLVAGRSLLRLAVRGTSADTTTGTVSGMDVSFAQGLTGVVQGWVLWDASRGMLVESYTADDARGTMRVPVAPGPMDVHLRGVSRIRLAQLVEGM